MAEARARPSEDREDDHLPSRTSELSYLYCWVCSEDELRNVERDPDCGESRRAPARRSRFIHPCKCSLVAHEKCLLSWVRQCRRNKPDEVVRCPQCREPYILEQPKPVILGILERCRRVVDSLLPVGATVGATGGLMVAAMAYGCLAIRLFLGSRAARRTLTRPWPWHVSAATFVMYLTLQFWVDIPLVPFVLVASHLPIFTNFSTWIPTLVALPVTNGPGPMRGTLMLPRYQALPPRQYPPSPVMTALFVPWIRVIYLSLKRLVYQAVLNPVTPTRRPEEGEDETTRRTPRTVIVGQNPEEVELVDGENNGNADTYETLEDGSIVRQRGWFGEEVLYLDDMQDQFLDQAPDMPQTIFITYYGLAKLVVGALSLPAIANVMGSLLGLSVKYSGLLAAALGMSQNISVRSVLDLNWFDIFWPRESDPRSLDDTLPFFKDAPVNYDDLDPVWYRNAVGAGLYIVLKDSFALLYRYLKKKQRGKMHIKDLPFSPGVARELMSARQ